MSRRWNIRITVNIVVKNTISMQAAAVCGLTSEVTCLQPLEVSGIWNIERRIPQCSTYS